MSELRDRIAAVLIAHPDQLTGECCGGQGFTHVDQWAKHVAELVIAELGLQPEYGHLDETDSGIIADTIPELGEPCPGETLRHRYITPWKDINETD